MFPFSSGSFWPFLFPHISSGLTSLFCFALFPINPPPPLHFSFHCFLTPLFSHFIQQTFSIHLSPPPAPRVRFSAPPSYRTPISHYVFCMCLRVIRHKAGAKQPNEQPPAFCSGPGDTLELLMYNSSEERREKKNSLTRSQITAQRKSCRSQRSPGSQCGSACREYFADSMFCRPKLFWPVNMLHCPTARTGRDAVHFWRSCCAELI